MTSLDLLATVFPRQPRMPLAFLATRAHCWLMDNLLSTRTPRSFSSELLPSMSAPNIYWCLAFFLPRCRTLHFSIPSFCVNYANYFMGRRLYEPLGNTDWVKFVLGATVAQATLKLTWKSNNPVWVEQWPLSREKLRRLHQPVEEQLREDHIVPTTSPWNSPVFVIQKKRGKWRLLHDLRKINAAVEDMGTLQPGMPSPTMVPRNWCLTIIDLEDCFFTIPLHPEDAPKFAFSVPSIKERDLGGFQPGVCALTGNSKAKRIECVCYPGSVYGVPTSRHGRSCGRRSKHSEKTVPGRTGSPHVLLRTRTLLLPRISLAMLLVRLFLSYC
ncbi:uncharacterized protein LOC134524983 [Chroicocephalus ridibundus]|uniref:uncharacterized protein LOC134524983 n=1 Tax=Chroicocephalus ridibundus TaxID=1192867 RepID=UPI002FDD69D0